MRREARGKRREGREGFTLVEVLVALVVGAIVLTAIMRTTIVAVRGADRTRERIRMQSAMREAASVLAREVGGLVPGDLAQLAAESLTVRSVRGSGRTCGTDIGALVMSLATYRAWRLPDAARDSILLPSGGRWVPAPILGPVTRGPCADGRPGLRLPVHDSIVARAGLATVALRVVEWTRYRLYQSGGEWWLGARSLRAGDVTQPVAGPFPPRGVELRYLDGAGNAATAGPAVRVVSLVLRARSGGTGQRAVARDSVIAAIALNGTAP